MCRMPAHCAECTFRSAYRLYCQRNRHHLKDMDGCMHDTVMLLRRVAISLAAEHWVSAWYKDCSSIRAGFFKGCKKRLKKGCRVMWDQNMLRIWCVNGKSWELPPPLARVPQSVEEVASLVKSILLSYFPLFPNLLLQ